MKSEHKIFLEKQDSVEAAVDTVIGADTPRVILNIPKGSVISASPENFRILSREARTAGKDLEIESVDDRVLELATFAGIPASNPIFRSRERAVSDIVAKPKAKRTTMVDEVAPPAAVKPAELPKRAEKKSALKKQMPKPAAVEEPPQRPVPFPETPRRVRRNVRSTIRKVGVGALCVAGVAFAWWLAVGVLPSAAIVITLTKNPVQFSAVVEASKSITAANTAVSGTVAIPGELLVNTKNVSMDFPTQGRETVEVKAKGKLTVSNSFSSESQTLVATTRFESPEGKVFRLVERTVIPGARIENGKIVPTSIEVAVVADAAGAEYNVAPSAGWHIPGFKGTAKYEAFTAEAKVPMAGGFIGERPVPSAGEIAEAREKVKQALEEGLRNQMSALHADGLKLLDDASRFSVVDEAVSSREDTPGTFSLYMEAELREIVFDERMLKDALVAIAQSGTSEPTEVHAFSIEYGVARVDFQGGAMSFPVSGTVVLKQSVDSDGILAGVLGQDGETLRSFITGIHGVERASITLSPFWVNRVPSDATKVTLLFD
jgi:hypothetical protein